LLVPIWFALQPLVQGENCPAPLDVEARVRVILHLGAEQELREGFIVERHEAGLYVELRSADSTLIGERTLPTTGSCDELAQAAAVVLSTWLSDVHPDFAGALPERSPDPEAPAPVPAPKPEPTARAQPKPAALPAPARSTRRRWDLALGIGGDLTGGRFTVALPATLGYELLDTGFGVQLMTIVTPSRHDPLFPGQVSWRRWPLGVGPTWRSGGPRLAAELSPGVALAWLHVAGQDFDHNGAHDAVVWGGYFNVRVSSRGRHWGVFGLADAQFYPIKADVYVSGVQPAWPVPRWSLVLAAGVDFSP